MKYSKWILPVVGVAVAGTTWLGVGAAHAATATDGMKAPSIVQELADKFHLNATDVQGVFDTHRTEMEASMQANAKAKIDADVASGKITSAQEQLIIAERQTLQSQMKTQMESMKNMTEAQRKTAMDAQQKTVQAWATANGIDVKYLFGRFGPGAGFKGGFHGHGGMMGQAPTTMTP